MNRRPKARGSARTGPRLDFLTDEKVAVVDALETFARSRQHSVLELAMSWLASHPLVASVIAGATSPEQVRQNAAAAGWRLTESDRSEIDKIAPL